MIAWHGNSLQIKRKCTALLSFFVISAKIFSLKAHAMTQLTMRIVSITVEKLTKVDIITYSYNCNLIIPSYFVLLGITYRLLPNMLTKSF